jgi:hypothetical protein
MINIDYSEIDNLLRLHEKIGQDKDLRCFIETERNERILKLAKLPKRFTFEESITRMIGFFVI